jgi:restriction endonuclease Mrr
VLVSQISEMNFRFVIATGDFGSGVLVVPVRSSVAHINWLLEHLMGRHPGGEEAEAARAEGIAQRSSLHYLLDLSPSGFERAVAEILATNGYLNVEILGGAGDLGADLRCADSYGQSVVVQCKQYAVGRKVTSQEMQLFIGMGRLEHRADRLLYVTTAEYTKAAMALAAKHGVELFDGQRLVGLGRGTGESP